MDFSLIWAVSFALCLCIKRTFVFIFGSLKVKALMVAFELNCFSFCLALSLKTINGGIHQQSSLGDKGSGCCGRLCARQEEVCEGKIEKSLVESQSLCSELWVCLSAGRVWSVTESDELYLEQMPQRGNIIFETTRAMTYFFYPKATPLLGT